MKGLEKNGRGLFQITIPTEAAKLKRLFLLNIHRKDVSNYS
jgi:hypothetical protein